MQTLDRNLKIKLLEDMNDSDLINYCYRTGNKEIRDFCDSNQDFWRRRLVRFNLDPYDPEILKIKENRREEWHQIYILMVKLNRLRNWHIKTLKPGDPLLNLSLPEIYNLKSYKLRHYNLKELPDEIYELVNLTELHLDFNYLTRLSPKIGNLINLDDLALSDNRLTELPIEIGQLRYLDSLFVEQNLLSELPREIGELKNLRYLGLADNRLTDLPYEITQLRQLKQISLSYNLLNNSVVDRIRQELPNLEIV